MKRTRLRTVGLLTGLAAFTATAVLALAHNGGAGSQSPPSTTRSTDARLRPAPVRIHFPKGP
jgi:hypothetical protein